MFARRRIADSAAGISELHELVAEHTADEEGIVVGIETDRSLLENALIAAG